MAVTLSPYALSTLDELKLWLNIALTDGTQDDFLKSLINAATTLIEEKVTHRRLVQRAYVNDLTSFNADGTVGGLIYMREFPVASIEQVILNDSVLTVADLDWDPAGWIRLFLDPTDADISQWQGSQNVRVDYTAGYSPIPDDLKLGCWELAAHLYMRSPRMGNARAGVVSRTTGGVTVSYGTDKIVPTSVMEALASYARSEWVPNRVRMS